MFHSINSNFNPLANIPANLQVKHSRGGGGKKPHLNSQSSATQNTQGNEFNTSQNSINSNSGAGSLSAKGTNLSNSKQNTTNSANLNTNQTTNTEATRSSSLVSSSDLALSSKNKVLGYEIDENGYFTQDFNKVAGIPSDYKIHSSTMESLVRTETNTDGRLADWRDFTSIDIAKTAGNAYKILSQVVGEDILNSKDSFTLDEIANFPQGYEYHRQTMEVTKIHQSSFDYVNAGLEFDYQNNEDILMDELFFSTAKKRMKGESATDIFNNYNGGKEGLNVFINTTPEKYTNADGSITKGGLLVAVINSNVYVREGETTEAGKASGFDKSMDITELKKARANAMVLKFDPENPQYVYGAGDINPNAKEEWEEMLRNYKDPLTSLFESMNEQQKLSLEELIEKQRELKEKIQKAILEKTKKVDIEA